MDKTYKVAIPMIGIVACCVILATIYVEDQNVLPQLFNSTVDARINAVVRRLNSEQISVNEDGSRFDGAEAIPGGIQYQVTMTTLSLDEIDRGQFRIDALEYLNYVGCFRRDIADLLKYDGIFVENTFKDRYGELITSIRIDAKSCRLSVLPTTAEMVRNKYVRDSN
jgi:hypothetical protein